MKSFRSAVLVALALASAPAFAAKKGEEPVDPCKVTAPTIEKTGIPEMDEVFTKARAIQDTVAAQTTELCNARGNVNTALGVATDAPVKTALEDLKMKASGKLQVALDGAVPKIVPAEDAPENVKAGAEAVNKLIGASTEAAKQTIGLVPEAQALAKTAAGFPMKVPTIKVDGVDIPTAIKVVGEDVKAMKQLPNQIQGLTGEMEKLYNDVKSILGA